jgi:hypothetical protein
LLLSRLDLNSKLWLNNYKPNTLQKSLTSVRDFFETKIKPKICIFYNLEYNYHTLINLNSLIEIQMMKKGIRLIVSLFILLAAIFVGQFSYAQEGNSTTLVP